MKDLMTNLYSYDYEAKAGRWSKAEIHLMIANEGLDGVKEKGSEVVKPKVKRKPPNICESSESDCEDSEVVESTVKRKPPKGLDTMSMEDWDLRLCLFCQNTDFKFCPTKILSNIFCPIRYTDVKLELDQRHKVVDKTGEVTVLDWLHKEFTLFMLFSERFSSISTAAKGRASEVHCWSSWIFICSLNEYKRVSIKSYSWFMLIT